MVLPQVSSGALDTVAEKREEVLVQDEVAAMDCNGSPPGTRYIYYFPQVPDRACDAVLSISTLFNSLQCTVTWDPTSTIQQLDKESNEECAIVQLL